MKASIKFAEILALVVVPATGHPNHFEVTSETKPDKTYRVRLNSSHAACNCDCEDWEFQCVPKLQKGAELFRVDTTCKHIMAAVIFDATRKLAARKAA